ncbi:hypothetical protein ANANG_G00188610 [Anguilla anguilla]|uniref:Kinase suppressor of ras 2 n=1 Tax=Anguilla anguilla TaxID=7936 RepID=A0A9D3RRN5_ANGAN|nr:hypothetical protein ANANG_G00188610 [Anguilla anguilla]
MTNCTITEEAAKPSRTGRSSGPVREGDLPVCPPEPGHWIRFQLSQSPKVQSKYNQHFCNSPQALAPSYSHVDRLTVEGHLGLLPPLDAGHLSCPLPRQRHFPHTPPRTPLVLIHLLPGFTALHRSKSHEFQLGNRVDEAQIPKAKKRSKPLNLKIHSSVGSCENLPSQRSPLLCERSLRSFFFPTFLPSTPPVHPDATFSANTLSVPRWSPQIPRRDLGNSIKHRFSTKYWMSQTCVVCGKGMLFGLKCKNCKLKCHNKCTKEAPPCHLLIIHRGDHQGTAQARLVRTESVPCDINNPLRYTDLHISQTLPKTNKINKCTRQQKQFNLTASHYFKHKQQFIFPDVAPEAPPRAPQVILHPVLSEPGNEGNPLLQIEVEPTSETEEGNDEAEDSEDEFEEMNLSLLSARNFPRKASQTSIFLQEWDIPFEQLEIGELIGKGRFGQVFHGRWHGEVAIRLIDIERDNEDQLKAFKREVMAYRNTRHENVVLFMGACMSPPHLAIITSLCKGRTLFAVVRDAKVVLDVNKTRHIAQEMVKGMGYLHAKGILHKDMKSKNVFYDNGKVVITDFGLFTISGVLQAGSRREDKLRIPSGWLCHLAPEIIRQLSPRPRRTSSPSPSSPTSSLSALYGMSCMHASGLSRTNQQRQLYGKLVVG